jgi:hypothetical protein
MQRIRAYAIASCLALLGLAFVPQAKADEWNKSTTLRINEPIRVPGMVLQPGDYVLELTDNTLSNRNIVQIFNSDRTQLLDTVITVPRERTTAAGGSQFSFWEMPAGQPPALRTWYFPGENVGQEFTYPSDVASQIAQYNRKSVPAYAVESASLNTATVGTVTSTGEFRASVNQPATITTTTTTAQSQPLTVQPRTDEAQAYAAAPGCPPSATTTVTGQSQPVEQPTVTAQVLPPYPIPSEQTATTQPCECPPSAAATQPGGTTTTTTTTTTTQPGEQQPLEQQPQASTTTTTVQPCPPEGTQPGVTVQPRTDEANEYYESNEANQVGVQPEAQPCVCPPSAAATQSGANTTQPGAQQPGVSTTTTVQPCPPCTTQGGVAVQPQTQPCECPPSAAVMQPGSGTTTTTVQPQAPAAANVQPCAPATPTQPGVTAQPETDEMNEYQAQPAAPAAAQPAPCQCPGITSPQMQTNTNTNTAATPMADHMCCQ